MQRQPWTVSNFMGGLYPGVMATLERVQQRVLCWNTVHKSFVTAAKVNQTLVRFCLILIFSHLGIFVKVKKHVFHSLQHREQGPIAKIQSAQNISDALK